MSSTDQSVHKTKDFSFGQNCICYFPALPTVSLSDDSKLSTPKLLLETRNHQYLLYREIISSIEHTLQSAVISMKATNNTYAAPSAPGLKSRAQSTSLTAQHPGLGTTGSKSHHEIINNNHHHEE